MLSCSKGELWGGVESALSMFTRFQLGDDNSNTKPHICRGSWCRWPHDLGSSARCGTSIESNQWWLTWIGGGIQWPNVGGAWPNLAALVTLCGGHEVSNAWKSMGQWRRIPVGWPLAGESWTGSTSCCRNVFHKCFPAGMGSWGVVSLGTNCWPIAEELQLDESQICVDKQYKIKKLCHPHFFVWPATVNT